MENTIRLPLHGIIVNLTNDGGGSVSSDLKESCPICGQYDCHFDCDLSKTEDSPESEEEAAERMDYNNMIDGIESVVLGHACAGVDIESPAYLEGIETAIDACAAHS